ncbi:MAG: hypothetical protein GY696_00605 [Gammaproteobacteria bacterium]|nr:hypothetical protein [Gammaproteobacteria bacterium]
MTSLKFPRPLPGYGPGSKPCSVCESQRSASFGQIENEVERFERDGEIVSEGIFYGDVTQFGPEEGHMASGATVMLSVEPHGVIQKFSAGDGVKLLRGMTKQSMENKKNNTGTTWGRTRAMYLTPKRLGSRRITTIHSHMGLYICTFVIPWRGSTVDPPGAVQ